VSLLVVWLGAPGWAMLTGGAAGTLVALLREP
jgi:hypothetical protein